MARLFDYLFSLMTDVHNISFHFIQVKGILITIKQESHLRQL